MSDRDATAVDPGSKALADLAQDVRMLRAQSVNRPYPHGGSATVDFTATGTDEASVAVAGQTGVAVDSIIHAWVGGTTADNDADAHLLAARLLAVTIESVVAGTGFTIRVLNENNAATKTFNVYWEWF